MTGPANPVPDSSDFVETDPSGRYGRYNEILGKGASKTVYKAFDEYEGIEVAWNQVKLYDFLQSPEDLERLYCEIHLLKTLKHENIMKFYTSWVDTANRNINFVTEMFTSGTLRQYRLKHKRVNVRAVKHWCIQILKGLLYLHSLNPPVIHRDLKCDNIFINGNTGEVKIGDLGLAAILKKSYAAHCVGTPEFMAPEVYEEEYNELVDIYSFGMCLLEMVTLEYPYSECHHPAQIYKKVVTGKKPEALYKVEDAEVREFIEKCLASVSSRLSAKELLKDPFLRIDDYGPDFRSLEYRVDSSISNSTNDLENEVDYHQFEIHPIEFDLFSCQEDEHLENVDISIKGKRREDDGVFLRLRIADEEGRIRNIYFPFDIENDTALSVAAEMVSELDIADQDVLKIAEMIDSEIATLVPEWKIGREKDEISKNLNSGFCNNSDNPSVENLQAHGRFEDITYKVNGQEQKNHEVYTDIWAQREAREEPKEMIQCDQAHDKEQGVIDIDTDNSLCESNKRRNNVSSRSVGFAHWDDYENEIRQELRWLKSKYQMQLRQLKAQKTDPKTKRGFYKPSLKSLLSLHRATSLPVDALDV